MATTSYIQAQSDRLNYDNDFYNLTRAEVDKILPDWFKEDNANLITFLEAYYQYLNDYDNFGGIIRNAQYLRDNNLVNENYLSNLDKEYLAGRGLYDGITDLRKSVEFAHIIYRSKGSLEGIKNFFKLFYDNDVTVTYTRNQILNVTESLLDSADNIYATGGLLLDSADLDSDVGSRIVNDKLYQELALQITTSLDPNIYVDVYKQLAHPAGMYFEHDSA